MGIKTGISSWADRSLVMSGFYPRGTKPESRLSYYSSQFPIVENDSAYYALPPAEQTETWARRTPPHFTINVKAFALLTGHYTEPRRLPEDLRGGLPDSLRQKQHIYPKDLGSEHMNDVARRFCECIEPLRTHSRLGLVLFQFPAWFTWSVSHGGTDGHPVKCKKRIVVPHRIIRANAVRNISIDPDYGLQDDLLRAELPDLTKLNDLVGIQTQLSPCCGQGVTGGWCASVAEGLSDVRLPDAADLPRD